MGARPLKRAIDQYVIAPLAATIVEKRFPEGDQFVFVTQRRPRHPGRVRRSRCGYRRAGARVGRRARRAAGTGVDDAGAKRQRRGACRARDARVQPSRPPCCRRSGRSSRRTLPRRWSRAGSGRGPTASRRSRAWRCSTAYARRPIRASRCARGSRAAPSAPASPRASSSRGLRCSSTSSRKVSATHSRASPSRLRSSSSRPSTSRRSATPRAPGAARCSTCTAPGQRTGTCS